MEAYTTAQSFMAMFSEQRKVSSGLIIRRQDESIETVASRTGKARLLSSSGGLEVVEVSLDKDAHMFIEPPEDSRDETTETFYIVQGSVLCSCNGVDTQLVPGDSITAEAITDAAILTANVNSKLLYITNAPFFHLLSDFTKELMDLAVEVELKDGYTADHCRRLQSLSYATGQQLSLDNSSLYRLNYGAYLHDLGKIKVPIEILQKPAKLDPDEWQIIKQHPTFGKDLLEPTLLKDAGMVVEQHHERFDGSGYPFGLHKDDILIESYIVAVADTYDAMTTDRSYRKALSPEVAFAELNKFAGIHYPSEVVRAFMSAVQIVE